jgi:hypothetical protein
MPASPLTRSLVAAAAALVAAASACAGPAIPAGPGRPPAEDARLAAERAAEYRETGQSREARDEAVRTDARSAAQARAQAARAAAARAARKQAEARAQAARDRAARSAARAKVSAQASAKAGAKAGARAGAARPAAPARTSWPALNRAIASIPGYRDGIAIWQVSSQYGHYGITDANRPGAARIFISPNVPADRLYSVAAHEYGHAVVIANYGTGYGPYTEYSRDMASWFGGDRVTGLERAADCMARLLGASWMNYTSCTDPTWQKGARILLSGGRL